MALPVFTNTLSNSRRGVAEIQTFSGIIKLYFSYYVIGNIPATPRPIFVKMQDLYWKPDIIISVLNSL